MIGRVTDHLGKQRILNWHPGLPSRKPLAATLLGAPAKMSTVVSVVKKCPPIRDQGDLGSCTGFSYRVPAWIAQGINPVKLDPAPMFTYFNERRLDGTVGSDSGATIEDIYRAANHFGMVDEKLWPYDVAKFKEQPPQSVYDAAMKKEAHVYAPVPLDLDHILLCLNHGFPVNFGIVVYSSFMSNQVGNTGMVPMPGGLEKDVGGHAIDIVAMNATDQEAKAPDGTVIPAQHVVFPNSWGTSWGDLARLPGYGYLPIQYVTNPDLASDGWMIRSV